MYNVNELLTILRDNSYNKTIGLREFLGKKYHSITNQFEFTSFIASQYDLCASKNGDTIKFFLPVGEENIVYVLCNDHFGKRIMNYSLCKAVQNLSVKLETEIL